MSHPEHRQLTVYAPEGAAEQIPAPVQGTFEVPLTKEWPGSSVLGGNTWPAEKIHYAGGYALYLVMTITEADDALREHYLREEEGIFRPNENIGNTTTAES